MDGTLHQALVEFYYINRCASAASWSSTTLIQG
jgi:hypothetical protein